MNRYFYIILIILLIGGVSQSNATPRPPGPPGIEKKAPIDAGLGFLLLAGIGLGVKKIKINKQ